jgi:hypothetical protein
MRDIIKESFAEPKRSQGAPIPLFEKLIDDDRGNSRRDSIKTILQSF